MRCAEKTEPGPAAVLRLEPRGTEISFYDGVPLVPAVCPIVVLSGSNRDMGRQYAAQVIEIYGPWAFEQLSGRVVGREEQAELDRWADELDRVMPEVLEFARGWSEGACDAGVPLTFSQALAIWTGYRPPADGPLPMCSGLGEGGEGVAAYLGWPTPNRAAPRHNRKVGWPHGCGTC